MKEHINTICKTPFLENRRISTIHHQPTDDATQTLVVSLVFSRFGYCNSLLVGLPRQSLLGKLQKVQNCAARLVVRAPPHVHITPILKHVQLYYPPRSLRSSADTSLLKIPLWKCKKKGDRTFPYFGPSVWNSLPLHIRNATTIDTFKSALKTYLFNF